MYDYRVVLGILAILFGLFGEVLYLRYIFKGSIKPHPFSWLGWGLLDVIIFFAQITKGGGPGSWVSGAAAIANVVIALASLRYGEKRITWSDWTCFLGGLAGILIWKLTADPLGAVIIASMVNYIVFIPTFRKSYLRPNEESLSTFTCDIIKFILSIAALEAITPTTALFPAASAISNIVFVGMVLIRRRQLKQA